MSQSILYQVCADGEVREIEEFGNSWGSAAMVWTRLVDKYKSKLYPDDIPGKVYYRAFEEWTKLFAEYESLPLEWYEWNVLLWTFDYAIIKVEDFKLFISSLRKFQDELARPCQVCHLRAVALRIEKLMEEDLKPIGICYQHTSVSDYLWRVHSDEEEDESRPYNVNVDDLHHFAELKSEEPSANPV